MTEHSSLPDPSNPRTFLTARWCNLLLANYAVPENLLRPRLPPGLTLDLREGQAWASLVAFQFLDTRVLGLSCPGYRNFPEWNLRFYIRQGGQRGVCFIREFVPQRLVAGLARLLYNEPYYAAPMAMDIQETAQSLSVRYEVTWAGRSHRLSAVGGKPAFLPAADSVEHFFKEHSWGFGTSRRGKMIRYQVNHPTWEVYPVQEFAADLDWAQLYGPEWAPMQGAKPSSMVLAAGSRVTVFGKV